MIPGLLAAIAVFSYLLGGLNGAIIASKYVFHRDVRDYGSGNAGLTNFYRTFGAPGLAIVIGTDVLKTVIAVVAGGLIMGTQGAASTGQVFAGFCVMLGHIYPVFYGFRGGKGVLCAETMLLIVSFPTGLVSLLIFVGIVWATRYVSLGSICGALIAPIGVLAGRNTTAHINIVTKEDKPGIDIYIAPGTKNESVHIPVIISQTGLKDMVYNDFYVGEDCDVTIVAGCGIHNCGTQESRHDGIHSFFVGKNAKVRYIEKHYGEGDGNGENVMNPTTIVDLGENAYMEMETTQIKGIDSTYRDTQAHLSDGATLIIKEKIMTHGHQHAETNFSVDLDGYDSSTNVISRSVAKDHSSQMFNSNIRGNNKCAGHSECDAIIMDEGTVGARPEITANSVEASLIHEAAIGKIAGEQLNKLMTLGLTEKEAEEQIISGFLK